MGYPVYEDNGGIAADSDASVVCDYPETVNENDICIVQLLDADDDTFTEPTGDGWNKFFEDGTNANCSVCYMWKRCDGDEGGTTQQFDSQNTAGQGVYGVISRYSGVYTGGTPYERMTGNNVAQIATYVVNAVVTTGADRLVLSMPNVESDVSIATPTSESFTEAFYVSSTLGGDCALKTSYYEAGDSETTTSDTPALGGTDYRGSVTLALLPTSYVPATRRIFSIT